MCKLVSHWRPGGVLVGHRANPVSRVASLDPSDCPLAEPARTVPEEPILRSHSHSFACRGRAGIPRRIKGGYTKVLALGEESRTRLGHPLTIAQRFASSLLLPKKERKICRSATSAANACILLQSGGHVTSCSRPQRSRFLEATRDSIALRNRVCKRQEEHSSKDVQARFLRTRCLGPRGCRQLKRC
jgi:hypothetical protein